MKNHWLKIGAISAIGLLAQSPGAVQATPINGFFADEVVFLLNGGPPENGPAGLVGLPDGLYVDLDGGATTLRFADSATAFDYDGLVAPGGADLIVTDVVALEAPTAVFFGYGNPTDGNGDGIADSVAGTASLLSLVSVNSPSWTSFGSVSVGFYDFDTSAGFLGITSDFFVVIDDAGDFDLDSVQIIGSGVAVPEPSTLLLLGTGLVGLVGCGRRWKRWV